LSLLLYFIVIEEFIIVVDLMFFGPKFIVTLSSLTFVNELMFLLIFYCFKKCSFCANLNLNLQYTIALFRKNDDGL
jgi:hypothetical protein